MPTSTLIDVKNIPFAEIEDAFFARTKLPKEKKNDKAFFSTNPEVSFIFKLLN